MWELLALGAVLYGMEEVASSRRLNAKKWLLISGFGWLLLTVLFRIVMPLGFFFAMSGWALVLCIFVYLYSHKIPRRKPASQRLNELLTVHDQSQSDETNA